MRYRCPCRTRTSLAWFCLILICRLAAADSVEVAAAASQRRARPSRADRIVATPAPTPEPFVGEMPFLKPINDPIEPFNRMMFSVNNGLIDVLINPLTAGWRAIAPEPVRTSVKKAGNNLAYPVRLINTLAQGKGKGALSETGRFLINSTAGLLGFFDPAQYWGLKPYVEDFGQTFGWYGSGPGFYLVIPFLGPGSGRDYLGWIFDTALNPATYLGGNTIFSLNKMSFDLPAFLHMREVERDPYVLVRDMSALARKGEVIDYTVNASDIDPDPTLKWVFLKPHDKDFGKKAANFKAVMPSTQKKLPYSAWLHPFPAPLVFVLGGTGGHRMTDATLMLAEMLYKERFAVVTVSSSMNWEFMENAATAAVPGYPLQDAADVYGALDSIHRDLKKRYPGKFNRAKALMGFSLGGLHALFISQFADNNKEPGALQFDRYVAIDTPVDMIYALENLDKFYNAPMQWRQEERYRNIENTMLKALALIGSGNASPDTDLPFNKIESQYLIGLTFKLALRDAIYSSQKRENLHVLLSPLGSLRRQPAYDEIVKFSFMDYVRKFLIPYYLNDPNFRMPEEELMRSSSLRSIESALRENPRIRAFNDQNDFFLRPADLEWFKEVLGERMTIFSKGGHMGNLYLPEIQKQIMDSLQDLKEIRAE